MKTKVRRLVIVFLHLQFFSLASWAHRPSPLLPSRTPALDREQTGYRNQIFDTFLDQLDSHYRRPEADWLVDDFMLLQSIRILVARAQPNPLPMTMVSSKFGFDLPAELFQTFSRQIEAALMKRLDLPAGMARAIAQAMEQQALDVAKVETRSYHRLTGRRPLPSSTLHSQIGDVLKIAAAISTVDHRFDVPFVAGYSHADGRLIFIDRSVPLQTNINGQTLPVEGLLNVHELVEKALLDEFGTSYQSAHQIALRTEREVARANMVSWTDYDQFMTEIIEELGRVRQNSKLKISPLLDLLPYRSYNDPESISLLQQILRVWRGPACSSAHL